VRESIVCPDSNGEEQCPSYQTRSLLISRVKGPSPIPSLHNVAMASLCRSGPVVPHNEWRLSIPGLFHYINVYRGDCIERPPDLPLFLRSIGQRESPEGATKELSSNVMTSSALVCMTVAPERGTHEGPFGHARQGHAVLQNMVSCHVCLLGSTGSTSQVVACMVEVGTERL
jgi:hypothetical protein